MAGNILDRISNEVSELSKGERAVAQAILADPALSARENIAELAQRAKVSQPTVCRFCNRFGASGFRQFRLTLQTTVAQEPVSPAKSIKSGDSVNDITRKVTDSIIASLKDLQRNADPSVLARAVDLVSQSRRILICAQGTTHPAAQLFYSSLLSLGMIIECHSDPVLMYKSAAGLHAGDLCIALSTTGENRDIVQTVKLSMDSAVSCLSLCPASTTLADLSPLNVPCGYKTEENEVNKTGLFMMQAVLQILIAGVSLRRADLLKPLKSKLTGAVNTLYLNGSHQDDEKVAEQTQAPADDKLQPDQPITTLNWQF